MSLNTNNVLSINGLYISWINTLGDIYNGEIIGLGKDTIYIKTKYADFVPLDISVNDSFNLVLKVSGNTLEDINRLLNE